MSVKYTLPKALYFILACFFLGIPPVGPTAGFSSEPVPQDLTKITTPAGISLFVEIADTVDKRAQGLMFRKSLAADRGMLFIFPEMGNYTFWMKNTLIPLDILWMDESGNILHVESHVPICTKKDDSCPRYYSHRESMYVLELPSGRAKELALTPGTRLSLGIHGRQTSPYP